MAGPPSQPNSPAVRVVMTDRDVIERIAGYLQRAVIVLAARQATYKTPYSVTTRGLAAVQLMVRARRELGVTRNAQIEKAIATWGDSPIKWNYGTAPCVVDGCAERGAVKGLCRGHFNQWYKATLKKRLIGFEPRAITAADVLSMREEHELTAECELHWLAGLLEGEGCFSRMWSSGRYYPVVTLNMCARDVVERAGMLFGAPSVTAKKPRSTAWRTTFVASINGSPAAEWMTRLRPLMGERRARAIDAALEDYAPIRLPIAPEHCVVPGCEEPHRGRGLCHKHYMSWSRDMARGRAPRVKPLRSN